MTIFKPADILLPKTDDYSKWAVIACDQFTSEPEYWQQARAYVGDAVSALNLILPEAELNTDLQEAADRIHKDMEKYLNADLFHEYPASYIYAERIMSDGQLRTGLVGALDLEAYDYSPKTDAPVRATEKTVVERIPARVTIRRGAPVELPHVLLLANDKLNAVVASAASRKAELPVVYDCDLMQGGGHITGYLVSGDDAAAVNEALDAYEKACSEEAAAFSRAPVVFAVGDGNHSLASAKAWYEELKAAHPGEDLSAHPARYALVELGNIYEETLQFEAIHRLVMNVDKDALIAACEAEICAEEGIDVEWHTDEKSGVLHLDRSKGSLAVGILQNWLDEKLPELGGAIDYIHGDDTCIALAKQENGIAFILPSISKSELFSGIEADGVLPRKTFSMGHARDKRYYMEARKIQ